MLNNNVIVNGIEYPIVPFGQARLRLQLQAQHSKENLDTFCEKLEMCFNQAKEMKQKVQEMVKMGVQPKLWEKDSLQACLGEAEHGMQI